VVCEYNSTIYSRLCPWLLTWPNYEEEFNDEEDYDDDFAN
jgi:hypothetical protein